MIFGHIDVLLPMSAISMYFFTIYIIPLSYQIVYFIQILANLHILNAVLILIAMLGIAIVIQIVTILNV